MPNPKNLATLIEDNAIASETAIEELDAIADSISNIMRQLIEAKQYQTAGMYQAHLEPMRVALHVLHVNNNETLKLLTQVLTSVPEPSRN